MFQDDSKKIVDSTEKLSLRHMTDDNGTNLIKGIITNTDTQEQIVGNFYIPQEYILPQDFEKLKQQQTLPDTVFAAIEGTLVRVYFYDDMWNLSTNSRIDAFTSYWSGRFSFGKQFEDYVGSLTNSTLDEFLDSLDREQKYYFILPTTGVNRLGKLYDPNEPKKIYLVGLETASGEFLVGSAIPTNANSVWEIREEYPLTRWEDILDLDTNVIWYGKGNDSRRVVKCVTEEYNKRCQIRNNEPNLTYRYLSLLRDSEQSQQIEDLKKMYPEFNFSSYVDKRLNIITNYIYENYVSRYIKKEYVLLPKAFFLVMKKCHQHYLTTRTKTTVEIVRKILFEQDTKLIVSLLKNFSWLK